MIHTIDTQYSPPGFENILRNMRAAKQAGFTIPSESHFLKYGIPSCPLFEPLDIQYIFYFGKQRDMWGKDISAVTHHFCTSIFNFLAVEKKPNRLRFWQTLKGKVFRHS